VSHLSAERQAHGTRGWLGGLIVPTVLLLMVSHQAHAQAPTNPYSYTRTSSFSYYGDADGAKQGRLKTETVEPSYPALATVTSYDYDPHGNRTSVKTANMAGASGQALFAERSASSAFAAVASQPIKVGTATTNVSIPEGLFATSNTVDPNNLAFTESRSYDPRFGAALTLTGPNGLTTSWQLDDFGRPTRERRADGTSTVSAYCVLASSGLDVSSNSNTDNGDPLSCPTPSAGEAPADAIMFVHSVPLDVAGAVMGAYQRIYKDRLGRDLRSVTESFDGSAQASGKSGVAVYTDAVYNAYGVKELQTQPYFASALSSTTTGANDVGVSKMVVDAQGRSIAVYMADARGNGGVQTLGSYGSRTVAVTSFAYSALKITTTNDKGQQRIEEKNAIGELVRVSDASAATLVHQRDAFGNLIQTRDALGNTTTLTYDYRGRKTRMLDPDTGEWTYGYDALGQLVQQQSQNQRNAGTQTTLVYDVLGRLTQRGEPEYISNWRYDNNADGSSCMGANAAQGKGKLCQSSTTNSISRQYVYDGLGRPTSGRTTVSNGPSFAGSMGYDANTGRLVSQTYPTGVKVNYAYTVRGFLDRLLLGTTATVNPLPNAQGVRAASATLPAGSVLWQGQVVGAWGLMEQQYYGNGVTSNAAYEAGNGRITDLTAGPSNSVLSQHYTWDSLSNLTTRVDDNGDGNTGAVSETFSYADALNRLTNYTVSAPAIPGLARSVTLQYNALGMLLYKSDVGSYSYSAQGAGTGSKPHAVQSVSGSYNAAYTYDANGNVLTATAGKYRSISYTSFNLPDSGNGLQGASGSPKYTWRYDENHARLQETRVDGTGTRTTWSVGGSFEAEIAPDGTQSNRHMLSVGGQVIGALVSTGALPALSSGQTAPAALDNVTLVKLEYWHKDHLGSLITTSDHTGTVTARYAYDPFGKRRYTNGSYDAAGNLVVDWSPNLNAGTDKGYTGQEHLDDVGVVHMNGRLFDPLLGLFMQANPSVHNATNLQAYNRYSYCENNCHRPP